MADALDLDAIRRCVVHKGPCNCSLCVAPSRAAQGMLAEIDRLAARVRELEAHAQQLGAATERKRIVAMLRARADEIEQRVRAANSDRVLVPHGAADLRAFADEMESEP